MSGSATAVVRDRPLPAATPLWEARGEQSEPKRIAFATLGDARDVRFWSGTPHNMAAALTRAGAHVDLVGPLRSSLLKPYKAYAALRRKAGLARPSPFHAAPVARQLAADLQRRLAPLSPDVVFAPAGSPFVWNLPAGVKLVYASDATFRLIENYYAAYGRLPRGSARDTQALEARTIARADLLLYPSDWAARSAVQDYGADPAKVAVVPWGANLATWPDREDVLAPRAPGPWRLLLTGVDWRRKGADIAVDALRILRRRGVEVDLTVCGTTPPQPIALEGLTVIPYLDKSDPNDRVRFDALLRAADLFVLPTQAECYGIAFCEAAAFGVPSVAARTGGVAGAVIDGESGVLLAEGATAEGFADAIAALLEDADRLDALRRSSRDVFEARLNWDAWAARSRDLIEAL